VHILIFFMGPHANIIGITGKEQHLAREV
jgi:hypothetical protein